MNWKLSCMLFFVRLGASTSSGVTEGSETGSDVTTAIADSAADGGGTSAPPAEAVAAVAAETSAPVTEESPDAGPAAAVAVAVTSAAPEPEQAATEEVAKDLNVATEQQALVSEASVTTEKGPIAAPEAVPTLPSVVNEQDGPANPTVMPTEDVTTEGVKSQPDATTQSSDGAPDITTEALSDGSSNDAKAGV